MSEFSNLILTDLGTALLSKVNSGAAAMAFTRWGLGAGIVVNDDEVRTLLALKNWKYWLPLSEVSRSKDVQVKVAGYITPDKLPETGFTLLEIGLFAQDPDLGEILYGVLYAAPGKGDYVPALGAQAYDYAINVYLTISDKANVTICYDATVSATRQELTDHAGLVVDPTQTGSDPKHVTNDQAKQWEDHTKADAPHAEHETPTGAQAKIDTAIAALIDSSPGTLNTLNELAAALGDDPNFATTVMNLIATKLNSATYTAADVMAKLKTVDGSGCGLNADLLDGYEANALRIANWSHGSDGYVKFPNGTIIQWGYMSGSTKSENFPIAFPNAARCVFMVPHANTPSYIAGNQFCVMSISKSSFSRTYSGVAMKWAAFGS